MTSFSRNPAVQDLLDFFARNDLGAPPLPPELATSIEKRRDFQWSSRELPFSPYAPFQYVEELVRSPPGDYVALSHDGHGANSYALHYQLVRGRLAMLLQIGWGGAYMDKPVAAKCVATAMSAADKIVKAAEIAERSGYWLGTERLLVVASQQHLSWWLPLSPERIADWEDFNGPPAGVEVRYGMKGVEETLGAANGWLVGRWGRRDPA